MADEIVYDLDGYEEVTTALLDLLHDFPMRGDEEIEFATLGEKKGKAMYPVSGAIVQTQKEDITGHITQECLYPFYVYYRKQGLSESNKISAKEWLDTLGRWLERQPIVIFDGQIVQLDEYPDLTGNRKFLGIERQTPSYLDSTDDNKAETWAIYITARYRNEYDIITDYGKP